MEIKALTDEEISHLEGQQDKIMMMLARIDQMMVSLNEELIDAEQKYAEARMNLEIKKHKKSIVVERARNLKQLLKQI